MASRVAHSAPTRETRASFTTHSQGTSDPSDDGQNGPFRQVDGSIVPAGPGPSVVSQITPPNVAEVGAVAAPFPGGWAITCVGCGGSVTAIRVNGDDRPLPNKCLYCAVGMTPGEYFAALASAAQRQAWSNPTMRVGGAA